MFDQTWSLKLNFKKQSFGSSNSFNQNKLLSSIVKHDINKEEIKEELEPISDFHESSSD